MAGHSAGNTAGLPQSLCYTNSLGVLDGTQAIRTEPRLIDAAGRVFIYLLAS